MGRSLPAARSVPDLVLERADLDGGPAGLRALGGPGQGGVEVSRLDDPEAAQLLLGLGERTVGDDRLSVADADGARPAWRSQLVAGDPDAPRLEVVQPGEALFVRSFSRLGLGLGVHVLGVQRHFEGRPDDYVDDFTKLFSDPDLLQREIVVKHQHPLVGTLEMFGRLIEFSETPTTIDRAPLVPGQHSRELLSELSPDVELVLEDLADEKWLTGTTTNSCPGGIE